ncbi:MAG: hypothetical protein WCI47_02165 [bacterium]
MKKINLSSEYFEIIKSKWFIALLSFILGAVVILGIRFITYKPDVVHYHANFAVYVNGTREKFEGPQYYTEVNVCTDDQAMTPLRRAHLHDEVNDTIHIHDHAVTWGHFFANLGWNLGATYIVDPSGKMYPTIGANKLHIILNGTDITNLGGVANTVISSEDRLLLSYGDIDETTLKSEFEAVASSARKFNLEKDPKSCGGDEDPTIADRLKHIL